MNESNTSQEFEEKVRKAVSSPNPRPEFVSQLRFELISQPVKTKPRLILKPVWAIAFVLVLVLVLLVMSAPRVATAIRQLFGYVPGVGLVESASELRVLKQPVSETRDEITVSLDEVIAYQDHVELSYSVEGIPPAIRFDPDRDSGNENAFCFGRDSYPTLLLPDGTTIEPDPMGLSGKWLEDLTGYNAGHSFSTPIPEDIDRATFVLNCLSETKHTETTQDWSLSFKLKQATDESVIGSPVINVEINDTTKATDQGVTLTLDKVVKEADGYVIYVTMGWDETSNSRLSTVPMSFKITDSAGQTILVSPIDHPGRPWNDQERQFAYKMASAPADGPLTLTVDKMWAFYTMDKTKEMMQQPSLTFTSGANPQLDQTWNLDQHFQFGDMKFDIPSVRMVQQDGYKGYEFIVQTSDPNAMTQLEIGDFNTPNFWSEYPSEHGAMLLYDGELPQTVNVLVYKIGKVVNGNWRVTWTPPAK